MFKAILWDMDGTIVDTERVVWEVMRQSFKTAVDVDLPQALFASLLGQSEADFYRAMSAEYNLEPADIDYIREHFDPAYVERLRGIRALPGAVEKVREFHSRAPQSIVTGSTTAQANTILKALDIADRFVDIVSCDVYRKGKPDPEPFLMAAGFMNAPPEFCLVLEDSPAGVTAAKEAGMKVIGIHEGNQGKYDIRHADWEIASLSDLDWDELLKRFA